MKGSLAWIVFGLAAIVCLLWIGFGVRDELNEDAVFHDIIAERIDRAESNGDEVHIGVAGDWAAHKDILTGVEMAAKEINEDGGILGKKIILNPQDDQGTVEGALAVAQEFASTPEIAFVIGHTRFGLNAAVAQNYEYYGILSISPNTSTMGARNDTFSLFHENGIPPEQIGGAILGFAKKNNWTRLGLIYTEDDLAIRYARRFETIANRYSIQVPLVFAFAGRGTGISKHMEQWKRELDLDAIVLAIDKQDILPIATSFRAIGMHCPLLILSDKPAELTRLQRESLGDIYFLDAPGTEAYAKFAERFARQFAHTPSTEATLGYDALFTLSQAIDKAGSFVPAHVAKVLRNQTTEAPYVPPHVARMRKNQTTESSVSGTVRFDMHGTAIKYPPEFVRP